MVQGHTGGRPRAFGTQNGLGLSVRGHLHHAMAAGAGREDVPVLIHGQAAQGRQGHVGVAIGMVHIAVRQGEGFDDGGKGAVGVHAKEGVRAGDVKLAVGPGGESRNAEWFRLLIQGRRGEGYFSVQRLTGDVPAAGAELFVIARII